MTAGEANLLWARLVVEELRRNCIDYFCLCPGSRSSPLALALSLEEKVDKIVHQDERGAAYHAVGYARATGSAAAVITTSGTAAANLFPAVVEAAADHLPLIVITADRPPELRNCGANQTIDQVELFGGYVRYFADLSCPDEIAEPFQILKTINDAIHKAHCHGTKPGPTHLNFMYREPLVPEPDNVKPLTQICTNAFPQLSEWLASGRPFSNDTTQATKPNSDALETLSETLTRAERGLLLAGRLDTEREQSAVLELAQRLGWPLLPDITSGLGFADQPEVINYFDLILASDRFRADHFPDTILHIGGRFVSKRLLQFIEATHPTHYLQNNADSLKVDPAHAVTQCFSYDNALFSEALATPDSRGSGDHYWLNSWSNASQKAGGVLEQTVKASQALTEPWLAHTVSGTLHGKYGLFLASSMPVRDMDMFGTVGGGSLRTASNRGASGIDGTIASACGYAVGLGRPVTLLTGDHAFLHDMNSLAMLNRIDQPLTIVVANNDGGRIFEQLPISKHTAVIEPFFVAPHGLTFEKTAATFGIDYIPVSDRSAFTDAFAAAQESNKAVIIEVAINPTKSSEHRKLIVDSVVSAVEQS